MQGRASNSAYGHGHGISGTTRAANDDQFRFVIYREDQVKVTSTLFCGGSWRWRLCAGDGSVIATSVGYRSEEECRAAAEAVRRHAASATLASTD